METKENFTQVMHPIDAKRVFAFEEKLEQRIDLGVEYLDSRFGKKKWLERVNESVLNVRDGRICITGQLFGEFSENWLHGEKGMNLTKSRKFGFFLPDSETKIVMKKRRKDGDMESYDESTYVDGYNILTHLWYCRIHSLRKVRKVAYTGQ